MNFFGHAAVASWQSDDPAFVLGSMVPDFLSMARSGPVDIDNRATQAGIALHHRTDDAFHGCKPFVEMCAWALRQLSDVGVRRGTARAVAHLGTEMFLDGWLTDNTAYAKAYLRAIEITDTADLNDLTSHAAMSRLLARLREWGLPQEYQVPVFVAERLDDALKQRPRLRIKTEDAGRIAAFLPELRDIVFDRAPELLTAVSDRLSFDAGMGGH